MTMSAVRVCLFLFLSIIGLIKCDHRKEEFKRIKKYELIYFDIDDVMNRNIFEFDAFNQHYIVELIENKEMNPSNIKHTNGIPKHIEIDEYYTSLTRSCHFYGKVLNDKTDPLQRVSLSICNKRGIRGEIRAFNETLIIKPSKYYLDIEYDNNNFHDIKDEHLIWRYSDFDSNGIPELEGIHIDDGESEGIRRRLIYNGGTNQVELLVATDPPMTQYYKSKYAASWYQQISADIADYVNAVSSKYMAIDFNYWDIGTISVYLVELEIIDEFTGKYASLNPGCMDYRECSNYDYCQCTINGVDYLLKFNEYIKTYKDQSTFDNAQMITKYYFANAGGYGWVGKICKNDYNVANIANNYGYTHLSVGGAHEMGHNFGCNHDGDGNNCGSGEGMMGGAHEGFSYCSMQYIHTYFWESGGLTCLGDGVRGQTNSGNNGDNGNNNNNNGNNGNNGGGCNYYNCIGLWYMETSYDGNLLNNYYKYTGCHNGAGYYKTDDNKYYLFRAANGNWNIYSKLEDESTYVYCSNHADDILGCANNMQYYSTYYQQWIKDDNVWVWECDAALNMEEKCENIELYNNELCIEGSNDFIDSGYNQTIWQLVDDSICKNNMPMYYFEIEDENITYYLHYQENKKYSNSNETFGEWVIKKDNDPFAYCKKENLLNCTSRSWYTFDINSDSLGFNIDNNMTIYDNNRCVISISSENSTNRGGISLIEVISICLILLVAITIIISGYCIYRNSKSKIKNDQKKLKQIVDDEPDEADINEQEIEVEVAVIAVTQTND